MLWYTITYNIPSLICQYLLLLLSLPISMCCTLSTSRAEVVLHGTPLPRHAPLLYTLPPLHEYTLTHMKRDDGLSGGMIFRTRMKVTVYEETLGVVSEIIFEHV